MLQFHVRILDKVNSFVGFLFAQQVTYILFGLLAFGNLLPKGHYSWPAWITVVLLWIITAMALLVAVTIGIIWPTEYFRGNLPAPASRAIFRRVKLNLLFLGLGYALITAWGIVSLTGHHPHYLTQAVFFITML
jgi:hypothetical protein